MVNNITCKATKDPTTKNNTTIVSLVRREAMVTKETMVMVQTMVTMEETTVVPVMPEGKICMDIMACTLTIISTDYDTTGHGILFISTAMDKTTSMVDMDMMELLMEPGMEMEDLDIDTAMIIEDHLVMMGMATDTIMV